MSIIIHPALSPRGDGDVMTRRAQSDGTSCRVQYRAQPPFPSSLLWICFGDEDCVLCEQKRPDTLEAWSVCVCCFLSRNDE